VRREVLRYVAAARAERRPWLEIATTVGLSKSALTRWRRTPEEASSSALRRVRVVEAARPVPLHTLAVVTASGHRIEGLSLADVIEVVRALG
jgi:hypothetical protein